MDKQAYLDQISVKTKKKATFNFSDIFTPLIIKLLVTAVILIITFIIVGAIISQKNHAVTATYESLYARVEALSDKQGPFYTYHSKLRSTNLRSYSENLYNLMTSTKSSLSQISPKTNINMGSYSSDVVSTQSAITSTINTNLETAYLNGNLDRVFASELYNQILNLRNIELQVVNTTNIEDLKNAASKSYSELESLEELVRDYSIKIDNA